MTLRTLGHITAARVAEAGFTPQTLGSMAMIFGLTRLDREMHYLI